MKVISRKGIIHIVERQPSAKRRYWTAKCKAKIGLTAYSAEQMFTGSEYRKKYRMCKPCSRNRGAV